jgi:hypothetical protein
MTHETLISELDKFAADDDARDDASTKPKKKRRNKKDNKPQGEANVAEANILDTKPLFQDAAKPPRKAEPIFKHTTALKIAGKTKKRKPSDAAKPKARTKDERALLVMPDSLVGCVVHKFAGTKLPSHFLQK